MNESWEAYKVPTEATVKMMMKIIHPTRIRWNLLSVAAVKMQIGHNYIVPFPLNQSKQKKTNRDLYTRNSYHIDPAVEPRPVKYGHHVFKQLWVGDVVSNAIVNLADKTCEDTCGT